MAFQPRNDRAIAAQNAGGSASTIYAALVSNRGDTEFDAAEFDRIRQHIFDGTVKEFPGGGEQSAEDNLRSMTQPQSAGDVSGGEGGSADPGEIVLNFGKHRGKTVAQAYAEDSGWVEWAADKANNQFVKRIANEFLAQVRAA